MELRICSRCNSEKTYTDKKGCEYWYYQDIYKIKILCRSCYKKDYRLKNKGKIKIENKEYYKNNKEKCKKLTISWQKNNPKKFYRTNTKYLTKQGSFFSLTAEEYKWQLQKFSKFIKEIFNFKCAVCGNKSENVHHIIHRSTEPRLSFVVNNGIALCKNCHNETHGIFKGQNPC